MKYIGRFVGDWKDELQQTIDNSKRLHGEIVILSMEQVKTLMQKNMI